MTSPICAPERQGHLPRPRLVIAAAGALVVLGLWPASARAQGAELVKRFGDWATYRHGAAPQTLCFATSQPRDIAPKGVQRGAVHVYVSSWPGDGVKAEVSVAFGYPLRKGSRPTVAIGAETFPLLIEGERGFVEDANAELKLVEAIKKGSRMVVKGVSERGTETLDTYSLAGAGPALQQVAQGCQ